MNDDTDDVHPTVNPIFVPIEISENEIEFRVGPFVNSKHTITDTEGEGVVAELLGYFDGSASVEEILENFDPDHREQLRSVIEKLIDDRVVVDATGCDPDSLWSYSTISDSVSEEELERLRKSTVGIATRGRLGEMVATDLFDTGVEDVQIYCQGESGLTPENDHIEFVDGELEDLIAAADYVLCTDTNPGMSTAKRVNEVAFETDTPVTFGQLLGVEAILGPTVVPGQSPCFRCLLRRWQSHQDRLESYWGYIESEDQRENVHLPSHERLLAGFISKEATSQLLTGHGYTVGRTLDINLLSMDMETNEILKMPRCEVCGVKHEDWQRIVSPEVLSRE